MASTYPFPQPGDVLAGKYVLRECIGAGGMGRVFVAEEPASARRVAIKLLHPQLVSDETIARRFRDEALAASRVHHRGSVAVLEYGGADGGAPFMVMELVAGRSLARMIDEEDLALPRALEILDQLLDALGAAHACGVVHADIKSDNVMVSSQGGLDAVTLVDFGLAQLDGVVVEPGQVSGTPEYLAPELIRGGAPTSASDLYAAGVILYELLTGATPFAVGSTSRILQRHLTEAVAPPSRRRPDRGIPEALDRIALRALEKDPAARFASAQELRDALAAVSLEDEDAGAAAAGREQRPVMVGAGSSPGVGAELVGRARLARGSDAAGARRDELRCNELRQTIASALARGDAHAAGAGYTALAATLVAALRVAPSRRALAAAIDELEDALEVLTAEQGLVGGVSEPLARVAASLAALYELAGEQGKARLALACADGHDTLIDLAR